MKNLIKMIRGSALIGAALMAIAACSGEEPGPGGDGDGDGDGDQATCGAGALLCSGTCINPQSDPNNCGVCGSACGAQFCSAGVCSATCGGGLLQCGTSCADTQTDFQNCGGCGTVCPSGVCTAGVCQAVETGTGGAGQDGTGGGTGTGGAGDGTGGAVGGTGGVINNGGDPPGFWRYDTLQGCAWTGVDDTAAGTTIAPTDFTTKPLEDAYCVSGAVGPEPEYQSVALLGFNIGQDPATADCTYDPAAASGMGPPGVVINTAGTGIAANVVKQGADTSFTFRIQIQGADGATNENARWCAELPDEPGKVHVPWTAFNTKCWQGGVVPVGETAGIDYAGEPISAVVFLVPGAPTAVPYDFCVNGLAVGDTADDAPDGPAEQGDQTGTVGYTGSEDGDFDRVRIYQGGNQYIIQNNNWGNPAGSDLILDYFNNSFTVASGNGSSPGGGIPASFPSIFIGANGNIGVNGTLSTSATDSLPKQVSTIGSIPTTAAWSGSTSSFNVTYDVWFANSPPTPGSYNDGIDGFLMVWLRDPPGEGPIGGNPRATGVSVAGYTWDVYVGPRGDGPEGYNDAPVVSFTAPEGQDRTSVNFDLKEFFDAAIAGEYGITSSMYLTDVFFGFEIWNGGGGGGLKVDSFTIDVQ